MQLSRSTAQRSALRRTAGPYNLAQRPTGIGGAVSLSADEGSTDAPGDCRLLRGRRRRFVGWPVLDTSRVRRPPATRSGAPPLGCIRSLFRRAHAVDGAAGLTLLLAADRTDDVLEEQRSAPAPD